MPDREQVIKLLEEHLCCSGRGKPGYCPYSDDELWNNIADALELLKEQEPHLLTIDEVCVGVECWIEGRSGACGYADRVFIGCNDDSKDYMRTWRCWDRRPTDEQRKAVPWDA